MARVALVGCGTVSREHYLPACRKIPECKIRWFVDTDIRRAQELVQQYGGGRAKSDYRSIIDEIDAAIVAVPNYLHSSVSLDFLLRGRAVLCEKPIATNTADAISMIETSRRTGARLAVNHHRRRYESYRIAKRVLDRDLVGEVTQVSCAEGRVFNWPASFLLDRQKAGGGVLIDWGIHTLDVLQWFFDAKFDLASYEDDGLDGVEANCNVDLRIMRKDGEIPCRIMLSRTRQLANMIIIHGEKGSLEIRDSDKNSVYVRVDQDAGRICASKRKASEDYFAEQVRCFLDPSSNDYVTGTDALRSLEFVETCYGNRLDIRYPWETQWRSGGERPAISGKILVVGASGFLGTRLTEKLSLDYGLKVRAAVHRAETAVRLARLPVELVNCNVLDPDQVMKAVSGCNIVVNCTQDRSGGGGILNVLVKGSRNLLDAAQKLGVVKYIHISSAAVLGFSQKKELVDEKSKLIVTSDPYIRGKIRAEKLVMSCSQALPVVILRPTLIYGPFSRIWTTRIIEQLKSHQVAAFEGGGIANLVYVDDVVDAIISAIQRSEAEGQIFNVNNDLERILWRDYVQRYSEKLGIPLRTSSERSYTLQKVKNLLSILKDSLVSTVELSRSPETAALMARIPLVIMLGEMIMKGERRSRLEAEFQSLGEADSAAKLRAILGDYSQKFRMMNRQLYKVATCRALFSAEKARQVLGFEPTPFQEGISKTLEWASWDGYTS